MRADQLTDSANRDGYEFLNGEKKIRASGAKTQIIGAQ